MKWKKNPEGEMLMCSNRTHRQHYLTAAAVACAVFACPSLPSQELRGGWTANFPSNTMELLEVRQEGAGTSFVLRNNSGKHVTAFAVSHGAVNHTIDYFETPGDLAPGATYSLKIAKQEIAAGESALQLLAMLLADGTAQGDPGEIGFIRAKHLGRMAEVERVAAVLNSSNDLHADDPGIEALRAKIGSLPQSADEAISSTRGVHLGAVDIDAVRTAGTRSADGFLFGVRTAREDALWKINGLKQVPVVREGARPDREQALSDLRQLYKSLSVRNQMLVNSPTGGLR